PDGYTFLLGNAETNIINGVNIKLNYDVIEDFVPVIRLPAYAFIIVSKNAVPAKSLNDLVGWLKGAGGKPFQGMVGTGTAQHLCGLSFQSTIGAQWGFVPYRGGGPAMQDLIAGQFDIMCTATGSFLPLVRAGQIRAYAVTAPRRLESAQDIPTVDEAGMPGFYWAVWNALWAPKGTPAAAIEKLNAAALAGQRDPAFRKRMIELGLDLPPDDQLTPAALGAFHRAEAKSWIPLAQRVKALPPPAVKPEAKP
ncbi:MAG: tripartite tricarboxylate transporter substrate binding protein BugD, partial [Alphaproteobacteria bacterium]|nr:tripartite tricarboxylate transporter substrate binding protein BugD [Alphaproteobacteria bacterium]